MAKKITNLLTGIINSEHSWKIQLLKNWEDIIGNLSAKVQLEKINQDSLVLAVEDSCWLQELYLLSPVLIKTINKALDKPRIKTIRFQTASLKKAAKKRPVKKASTANKNICLTDKEKKAIDDIQDKELRESLKKILTRCHQEK